MARADNIAIAQDLLTRLGTNAPPDSVLELFADDVTWDVPGDPAAFPWIGRQTGRQSVLSFMTETVDKIERIRLEIEEILASDAQAVILGRLASRVRRTGSLIETEFAIVLTIAAGRIARFRMLEDSFAVSQAARAV